MQTSAATMFTSQTAEPASKRQSLIAACLAHALHDGYTDGLYAFLPVWQSQFGLSYAGLAMVRALYYGTMGGLQLPSDRLLRGFSARVALVASTVVAAAGYLLMAAPLGFVGLCVGLVAAGVGSSIQHPRGSLLVTETYVEEARRPLGVYNFSGDLGKATVPAAVALLLPLLTWRPVAGLLALLGLGVSLALLVLIPRRRPTPLAEARVNTRVGGRSGFAWLMAIGACDTATRMGYLLFLPFLIHTHGGGSATVGLALALLFIGGALGKATCGWLGDQVGVISAVIATETVTALLIIATLFTPLVPTLVLLPLLGVVLNGTSSVLYGTVPELAPAGDTGRAFAIFYTGVIGSGGLTPILYGAIADHSTQAVGALAAAATAVLIVPMALRLGAALPADRLAGRTH